MSKKHKQYQYKEERRNYAAPVGWVVGLGIFGGIAYLAVTAPRVSSADVESARGVHYHAHLAVSVDGATIPLPPGMGLTPPESPMHVHEADDIIHMEYSGLVKKDDIRLGKFFDLWKQDWTGTSFMGHPVDATSTLVMKVNGIETTEYRHYLMRDKDQIELIYKK
jgi:hypothetical protein